LLSDDLLGKGKYGQVYKATNLNDKNKIFAVKVIKIENEKVKE
jgi:serine/threonine protein kinase